jgi:hypothetical protein
MPLKYKLSKDPPTHWILNKLNLKASTHRNPGIFRKSTSGNTFFVTYMKKVLLETTVQS